MLYVMIYHMAPESSIKQRFSALAVSDATLAAVVLSMILCEFGKYDAVDSLLALSDVQVIRGSQANMLEKIH